MHTLGSTFPTHQAVQLIELATVEVSACPQSNLHCFFRCACVAGGVGQRGKVASRRKEHKEAEVVRRKGRQRERTSIQGRAYSYDYTDPVNERMG